MRACLWLALFACPVLAQSSAWAPIGLPAPAQPIIASTSKKTTLMLPPDSRLPPPDDGLRPPAVATTQPPRRLPPDLRQETGAATPGIRTVAATIPMTTGIAIEVRTADRIMQGQTLPCELIVRNGQTGLTATRIELPLPADTRVVSSEPPARRTETGLVWELGVLQPEIERLLRVELLPGQAEELMLRPAAYYTPAVGTRVAVVRPPVGLSITTTNTVMVGDALTLRIAIRNNTPSTLRRVALTCRLPEGTVHPQGPIVVADLPGEIPPGQERTEELAIKATQAGSRSIVVDARADGGLTAHARTLIEVKVPAVALTIQGPRRARLGEEFSVRLLVANPGPSTTPDLRVFLPLPEGVEMVNVGEGGAMHPAGGCLYWTLAPVTRESHRVVTATLRGRSSGDWGMSAVVGGEGLREVRTTQAVMIEHTPNLTVDLTRLDESLSSGGETTYSVRVYNQGSGPTENVQPYFDLPEQLLPVQGEGPARWNIVGQRVVFDPMTMPARTDATFSIRVRAVRTGQGVFRAAVSAMGLTNAQSRELTVRVR